MNLKRIVKIIVFLLIVVSLYYYKLVIYGIQQLKGQLHIIYNAREVTDCLQDSAVPDSVKEKLLLIGEIRKYAIDSLGLKDSKNYTTYYDQKGKPVLWVVTACEPFAMKAYEWYFPFLGNVSYKGFFEKEKGLPEVDQLKRQWYDTEYSPVSAWSTLGWFRDPVLSNMIKRKEGQIAELIIHELTHATVYIASDVDYNENLATFVGEQGAIRFLNYKYGQNAKQTTEYLDENADEKVFGNYMVNACNRLDSLYDKLNPSLTFAGKLKLKYQLITNIVSGINQLRLYNKSRYTFSFPGDRLPNNAWFMSYKRYRSDQHEMEKQLRDKHNSKLELFVNAIRNK